MWLLQRYRMFLRSYGHAIHRAEQEQVAYRLQLFDRLAKGATRAEAIEDLNASREHLSNSQGYADMFDRLVNGQLAAMFDHLRLVDEYEVAVHGSDSTLLEDPSKKFALLEEAIQKEQAAKTALATVPVAPVVPSSLQPKRQDGLQLSARDAVAARIGTVAFRHHLIDVVGHALWVAPSQAPTPSHPEGVYLKGYAPPGRVVAMYPGLVYDSEHNKRAKDMGFFSNPAYRRIVIPRWDGAIIDATAYHPAALINPYAVGHCIRHPPPDIEPNLLRLDINVWDDNNFWEKPAFPKNLRKYLPTAFGVGSNLGQSLANMFEQNLITKLVVLIAAREIVDEELFVDHRLNPYAPYPTWYLPRNPEADRALWSHALDVPYAPPHLRSDPS